eukprot:jgi/Mesen1/6265/ME000323S05393
MEAFNKAFKRGPGRKKGKLALKGERKGGGGGGGGGGVSSAVVEEEGAGEKPRGGKKRGRKSKKSLEEEEGKEGKEGEEEEEAEAGQEQSPARKKQKEKQKKEEVTGEKKEKKEKREKREKREKKEKKEKKGKKGKKEKGVVVGKGEGGKLFGRGAGKAEALGEGVEEAEEEGPELVLARQVASQRLAAEKLREETRLDAQENARLSAGKALHPFFVKPPPCRASANEAPPAGAGDSLEGPTLAERGGPSEEGEPAATWRKAPSWWAPGLPPGRGSEAVRAQLSPGRPCHVTQSDPELSGQESKRSPMLWNHARYLLNPCQHATPVATSAHLPHLPTLQEEQPGQPLPPLRLIHGSQSRSATCRGCSHQSLSHNRPGGRGSTGLEHLPAQPAAAPPAPGHPREQLQRLADYMRIRRTRPPLGGPAAESSNDATCVDVDALAAR